jgi:preprotein translocase subunit SecG
MENILVIINIVLAIILVISILLQRSEGGALGLGVSQDSFTSSRSAGNFLTKFTSIIATMFIILSLVIVTFSHDKVEQTQSVLEREDDSSIPQIPENNK